MDTEQNDSFVYYYPVNGCRNVPLNVRQADSLGIAKEQESFRASLFKGHTLEIESPINLQPIDRVATDLFFIYLLITLIFTSIISQLYRRRFNITINAIWQNRFFNRINTESRLFDHPLNLILFLLYAANIAFLVTLSLNYLMPKIELKIDNYQLFLIIATSVIVFSFIKTSLSIFTSKLFKQDDFSNIYISHIHISENNIGIILLPFLWILLYHPHLLFYQVIFSILLLISILRIGKTFFRLTIATRLSAYQIFLYLCTIEILPLVVLVKIILTKFK